MASQIELYKPFEHYFDRNFWIFRKCGLWIPLKNEPRKAYYYFFNLIIFVYLALYQPAETTVMFRAPDLDTFLRSLRDQFNHMSCIYKVYIWFRHRKTILTMIGTMQDPKYNYDDCQNYFDVGAIVKKNKQEADRWMLLFLAFVNSICFNMVLMILYVFLFEAEKQYRPDDEGERIYNQQLAVLLITPFNQHTRSGFILHFIFEIIALVVYGWMIVGTDGMFTSIVSCISAHLDILSVALETIRPRCMVRLKLPVKDNMQDSQELQREMKIEMTKCVKHLDMILMVSSKIEDIYNIQTLFQTMISLFEMCFCLYFLSGSLDASMGPELTYLISTSFELLMYCWFGNSITESSDALTSSIYSGDWLSSNPGFKKSMLITMSRMQRPIYMTIGKFSPLTFTTFLSMSRVAYSFFTVLKSDALG